MQHKGEKEMGKGRHRMGVVAKGITVEGVMWRGIGWRGWRQRNARKEEVGKADSREGDDGEREYGGGHEGEEGSDEVMMGFPWWLHGGCKWPAPEVVCTWGVASQTSPPAAASEV